MENSATFLAPRTLRWNNAALAFACDYYAQVMGEKITLEQLLEEMGSTKLRAVQALLYGALRAADPHMTIREYERMYCAHNLTEYVHEVLAGIASYLPAPEVSLTATADEESTQWPDTQTEKKKKTLNPGTGDSGSGPSSGKRGSRSRTSGR